MKVLLAWPKARTDPEWGGDLGAIAEPLSLEYLAAGAKLDGHHVRVLDLRLHPDELDATLREFRPDVVGITAFSMHVRAGLAVCARVKELLPDCRTVAGGHHATFLPEDFFEEQVDYVVSGEGVQPFRRLLSAIHRGAGAEGIPGVSARVRGEFVTTPPDPHFDVDSLPLPDRSVTERDRDSYFIDWMKPVALVRTTVGCPYRCTFCSLWKLMDGHYHMRAIDSVVAELQQVEPDFVFLVDDEAFIHGKRMHALAEALAAAGVRKRFFAYCRIDSLIRNRDVVAAWMRIGLERLFIGIDAISPKDLAEYRKKLNSDQIEEGLRIADELGLEVLAQFVINTDYTRADFQRLIRFVEHHDIRYPSFTVLTPLPGTELLETFEHVVVRQPNGRPDWDYFDTQNAVTGTALPPDEFRREYRNLYRVFKGSYTEFGKYHTRPPTRREAPPLVIA
jgi:radical SAM superfamily enzyme YgiQ (UPF0313 family)